VCMQLDAHVWGMSHMGCWPASCSMSSMSHICCARALSTDEIMHVGFSLLPWGSVSITSQVSWKQSPRWGSQEQFTGCDEAGEGRGRSLPRCGFLGVPRKCTRSHDWLRQGASSCTPIAAQELSHPSWAPILPVRAPMGRVSIRSQQPCA
jgi:hypothetical protein